MKVYRFFILLALSIFQVFVFISSIPAQDQENEVVLNVDFTDYYLSVEAKNAKVSDLLEEISSKTGVKIVVESPIEEKISINFKKKGFTRGMRLILSSLKNGNYEGDFHLGHTFADSIYKIRKISKAEIRARREMHRKRAAFFNLKGEQLLKDGKDYRAYKRFIASLRADPYFLPAHKNLIRIFELWGDNERLINRIEKVINIEPDNAYNYLRLAEVYRREYFRDKALENYREFLDKNPRKQDADRVRETMAQMNTKEYIEYSRLLSEARDLIRDKQFDEAKKLLIQALQLNASITKAYELLAMVSEYQRNYQDAIKWRKSLAELAPDDPKNLLLLGRDLGALSQNKAALEYLRKAKSLCKSEYMRMFIEKELKLMK